MHNSESDHRSDHSAKRSHYLKKRRQRALKHGRCPYHPKREAAAGRKLCESCLQARRDWALGNSLPVEIDGKCPICRRSGEPLVASVNRRNGEPRGRICVGCDTGIGFFRDDIDALSRAARWLRKFKGKSVTTKYTQRGRGLKNNPQKSAPSTPNPELINKSEEREEHGRNWG